MNAGTHTHTHIKYELMPNIYFIYLRCALNINPTFGSLFNGHIFNSARKQKSPRRLRFSIGIQLVICHQS